MRRGGHRELIYIGWFGFVLIIELKVKKSKQQALKE